MLVVRGTVATVRFRVLYYFRTSYLWIGLLKTKLSTHSGEHV